MVLGNRNEVFSDEPFPFLRSGDQLADIGQLLLFFYRQHGPRNFSATIALTQIVQSYSHV